MFIHIIMLYMAWFECQVEISTWKFSWILMLGEKEKENDKMMLKGIHILLIGSTVAMIRDIWAYVSLISLLFIYQYPWVWYCLHVLKVLGCPCTSLSYSDKNIPKIFFFLKNRPWVNNAIMQYMYMVLVSRLS